VVLNLVSNAIKYNVPHGQISLGMQCLGPSMRLSVQDTGLGLTAQQSEHLFEPFNRLGRQHSNTPGTGIGLVISKHLLEQMGSTLQFTSRPEQGTTFYFDLPLSPAPGSA